MSLRCTDCNRPVNPVAAIDIDGTLANYHNHFLTFAGDYFDVSVNLSYDGSCSLAEWLGISESEYRQCKLAYRQGAQKRFMPTFPGFTMVGGLMNAGLEVWLTTTRPYLKFDTTDADTRDWLRRMGIPYNGLLYDDDKYAVLKDIVGGKRIVGVLDDLPANVLRAKELGLPALLIRRQHNINDPLANKCDMVDSLFTAEQVIKDNAHHWRLRHERIGRLEGSGVPSDLFGGQRHYL
jgi:hypothetical protein